jgi:hypothetical protein
VIGVAKSRRGESVWEAIVRLSDKKGKIFETPGDQRGFSAESEEFSPVLTSRISLTRAT